MTQPQAGRIRGVAQHTWPVEERPAVWVTVDGTRYPGREHGRGEGGQAVHVAYTVGPGQQYLAWVQAAQVEPRKDQP